METKNQNKKTNLRQTQNTPPAKQNNTSVINIIGCKKKRYFTYEMRKRCW